MTDFDIDNFNSYPGVLKSLLVGVDPKYYKAIATGIKYLIQDFGRADDETIDTWFTAVYGTVLAVEEVHNHELEHYRKSEPRVTKLNYEDIIAKEKE